MSAGHCMNMASVLQMCVCLCRHIFAEIYWHPAHYPGGHSKKVIDMYIYTKNPNDPCFDWKRPCFGGLTFKNRGHLGSRYIYIYMYHICV